MKPEQKFEYQVTLERTRKERIVILTTDRREDAERLRRKMEATTPRDFVVEIYSVSKSDVDSGYDSHDDALDFCAQRCVP